MALINCSECGNQVNKNDSICQNCGNPLNQNMFNTNATNIFNQPQEETTTQKLKCSECGNQVNENDSICSNCGCPLIQNEITENIEKIKATADTVKLFLKLLSYISLIVGIISVLFGLENGSSYAILGILCCIIGGILLFVSSVIETFIKWKAYMLETNYKIVKNTECEKNGIDKL